ncbi:MAG: ankyrin repeat domain-containing protein [Firmicutes bacterium]|nr:ankyrin repeat domain-containing protein [Gammaproteobacteria bacterium]MCL5049557.1 ankyrin repeat domain-containing protein [Bacillota bacterium]
MKKTLVVGVVLVVAVAGILWGLSPDKSLKVHQPQPVQAEDHPQPSTSPPQRQPRQQSTSVGLQVPQDVNFSVCESFIQTHDERRNRWLRDNYQSWARYIGHDYTLDDLTLVVEHFLHANFADTFRVNYLRRQTELGQELQAVQTEFERQYPEARDLGVRMAMASPPSSGYQDFTTMLPAARQDLIASQRPMIEDIAYFMEQSEVTDDELVAMLARVDDVNRVVHYHRNSIVSVFDHAVINGRMAVLQALLDQGMRPTNDFYLGSSMEHALASLDAAPRRDQLSDAECCRHESNAADIVALIQQYDSSVRFEEHNADGVQGFFPRNYFQFNAETLARLEQDYGLDIRGIESRAIPSISPSHPLIQSLSAELNAHLNADVSPEDMESRIAECRQFITKFHQAWQPKSGGDVMNQMLEKYPDDPHRVEAELAQVDPALVDSFRARQLAGATVSLAFQPEWREIEVALGQRNAEPAINFILSLEAADDVKTELAVEVIRWNRGSAISAAMEAGILPPKPEYFLLDKYGHFRSAQHIDVLERGGLDLRGEDSWGRTALHYAVRDGSLDAVNYLVAEGFPFGGRGLNQDPLHAALNPSNRRLPIQTMEPIVRELMTYQPEVDIFHHHRLAVMQLKYPDVYQALVADFPELEVPEGTELMPVRL